MTEITEKLEKSGKVLATMLDYLGLKADVSVKEIDGKSVLATDSEDAGRIIGKRGLTLQSLELLINRIATKNDNECPWITINVDGYSSSRRREKPKYREERSHGNFGRERGSFSRPRRERSDRGDRPRNPRFEDSIDETESLTKLALDSAKEVKRWGDSVTLRSMNSHDRRIVHVALKDDPEIRTESLSVDGSENLKNIVISLNKSSETSQKD